LTFQDVCMCNSMDSYFTSALSASCIPQGLCFGQKKHCCSFPHIMQYIHIHIRGIYCIRLGSSLRMPTTERFSNLAWALLAQTTTNAPRGKMGPSGPRAWVCPVPMYPETKVGPEPKWAQGPSGSGGGLDEAANKYASTRGVITFLLLLDNTTERPTIDIPTQCILDLRYWNLYSPESSTNNLIYICFRFSGFVSPWASKKIPKDSNTEIHF
jgi:hypothetical protein